MPFALDKRSTTTCDTDFDETYSEEFPAAPATAVQEISAVETTDLRVDAEDSNVVSDEEDQPHWKASPFAVGPTKETWVEERVSCTDFVRCRCQKNSSNPARQPSFWFSGLICGLLGAGRVGNMAVLCQTLERTEETDGQEAERPRLRCMVGPYWTVYCFLTMPAIIGFTVWVAWSKIPHVSLAVQITWALSNVGLFLSLLNVSFRDPGILLRQAERPSEEDERDQKWLWNDQAVTYRPVRAKFDPECAVVVENLDHTCPWVGTAIGKKNIFFFRSFLCFLLVALVYDLVLLTAVGGLF